MRAEKGATPLGRRIPPSPVLGTSFPRYLLVLSPRLVLRASLERQSGRVRESKPGERWGEIMSIVSYLVQSKVV